MNTVTKYNKKEWEKALNKVYGLIENMPNDQLKNNYSKENLKIEEWIALSFFDGGFSSLAHRDIWGNNCRILNRFYKNPLYRFENNKRQVSKETLQMIQQQLDIALNLGFDCGFMSREKKTQAFNYYKKHLPQKWYSPPERYLIYHNGYQHIMWTPINSNEFTMEKE